MATLIGSVLSNKQPVNFDSHQQTFSNTVFDMLLSNIQVPGLA
jgi:hypothetical protein